MAAKKEQVDKSKKRKRIPGSKTEADESSPSKMPKFAVSKGSGKPSNPIKKGKTALAGKEKKAPATARERRVHAKELAEARKKKRKRHYTLEQELARLWEKMRRRDIAKEDKAKLVTEALQKMKGKIPEIAGSHVSSRVLQTCVKHCSQAERDAVFEELRPHFLTLSYNAYAVHLLPKNSLLALSLLFMGMLLLSFATWLDQLVFVEHAYELSSAAQKQELLLELCSTELQLFKDLVSSKQSSVLSLVVSACSLPRRNIYSKHSLAWNMALYRAVSEKTVGAPLIKLVDVISKLGLQKGSVLRHMTTVIQPILEKGIVDHSIIHRLLIEYFSIADKVLLYPFPVKSAWFVLGPINLVVVMPILLSKDGAKLGILCVKHGSAKERKKIIKGMKGHIDKIAYHQHGCMVLVCIISVVDDTKLITKAIIRELQQILKELVLDKNGRRPLLQLLNPNCSRYFSPDDLAPLNSYIPSLSVKDHSEVSSQTETSKVEEPGDDEPKEDMEVTADEANKDGDNSHLVESGKKDPIVRRQELLIKSGLAESLIDICIENTGELIRSNFGKDVIYEVATGGSEGILHPALDDKINSLHEAIASLASTSKSEDSQEEHVLENFHSSRIIRKLILDCPNFASTLWEKALQGKSELWACGHSCKIISAFMESSDSKVHELVKDELQPLIDRGILKTPKSEN
ncbi:pumilio-like protein 24-like [Senna tora]|uniref:Pumilio-like protein 24-like n=1 Tax=Senna tora TaxID=362788 RepID=A0A834T3G1_9FABA|nr:pumilio-like protein 24-like [Senna tora]